MIVAPRTADATARLPVTGRFRALSYSFIVETALPEVAELVADLLHDLQADDSDESLHRYALREERHDRPYAVSVDGTLIRRVATPLSLVDELLWHANREAIVTPDPRIAIHASAAVWDGRGFLFPAPANSGKTTLVTALLREGAEYVTDEAALLEPLRALVHPYPKPLWMAPGAVRAIGGLQERLRAEYRSLARIRAYVTPRTLGTTVARGPVGIDLVVFPSYRQGGQTRLEPIGRAEAVVALARNAFDLTRFGEHGILALARLVERARCYTLELGDLGEAVRMLAGLRADSGSSTRSPHLDGGVDGTL
jgi:hypothetical protein